jgi:hypothetical protein
MADYTLDFVYSNKTTPIQQIAFSALRHGHASIEQLTQVLFPFDRILIAREMHQLIMWRLLEFSPLLERFVLSKDFDVLVQHCAEKRILDAIPLDQGSEEKEDEFICRRITKWEEKKELLERMGVRSGRHIAKAVDLLVLPTERGEGLTGALRNGTSTEMHG